MKTKLFPIVMALALAGCAAMIQPSDKELAAADCGPYPKNYEEIVRGWINKTFFDPYSVRDVEISKPVKSVVQEAPLMGGGRHWGWSVTVSANGKNRFGAYTGRQRFTVLIRDGAVINQGNPDSPTGY